MKKPILSCLASLLFVSISTAQQSVSYPEDKPIIDITFPEDWEVKPKKGVLYAHPADDASFFMSLAPLEATSADTAAGAAEVKEEIEDLFKNVVYQEPEVTEIGDLNVLLINAKGEDEDGKANINLWMITKKDDPTLLLLKCISSQEAFEKHGETGLAVIKTIAAHVAESTTQNFSFPSKENPEYSIDFPADWKMENNDEGTYVESPDKLIAMNVLFIDVADVEVARESMKKKVGDKYSSIEWNQGGEPEVNKDEALGLTAIFDNAVAVDSEVKYSVNFVQYVRKGSDKFLLLLSQQPLKALDTHGEAMSEIIKSIKVKDQ
jgi:hypothetical protein